MEQKIKEQSELLQEVKELKEKGGKIVTCNGSFDIIHAGHIELLRKAKKQGDVLVVLLNSDESVRKYKGPARPLNSEEDRAKVLSALEMVDLVTIFDELNPVSILEEIKPDIHCEGKDWGEGCIEQEVVEENDGEIHLIELEQGKSTTKLMNKLKQQSLTKAVFLDRDGTINFNKPEYVHKIENFEFKPKVIPALKKLEDSDYKIIIVTNQSGIGRDYFDEEQLKRLHQWMLEELEEEGIHIEKIYHCPHHPEEECECRKPEPGMLLKAVEDYGISLNKSWVVGDSKEDIVMGRRANVATIKLEGKMPEGSTVKPHHYADNLLEAVNTILKHEK